MPCSGNSETHCCWLEGKECRFLEENTLPDRRWVCGLRRELGDWDKVLASSRYKKHVAPRLELFGYTCKDWPDKTKGQYCGDCGYGVDK